MVIIDIVGINEFLCNIDITEKMKILQQKKYYLHDLKMDIVRYLKKQTEDEIYEKYNVDLVNSSDKEFYKITKTPLFKKWLNVGKN